MENNKFETWAIVELMGHIKKSGNCHLLQWIALTEVTNRMSGLTRLQRKNDNEFHETRKLRQ